MAETHADNVIADGGRVWIADVADAHIGADWDALMRALHALLVSRGEKVTLDALMAHSGDAFSLCHASNWQADAALCVPTDTIANAAAAFRYHAEALHSGDTADGMDALPRDERLEVTRVALERIYAENSNPHTHGILVQLPLPKQIDESRVIEAIDPAKDVDVFTPENVGLLQIGRPFLLPCTPAGCLHMIQSTGIDLAGKEAVVVGRSNIVGKPMAALLLAQNCTVTMCHSKTRDLAAKCASADILVAAIGRAKMITGDMIKPGAVVIDVGMNRDENDKLCGDVDYATASEVAGFITPVPGGVGPMTRAMLMANTIKAAGRLSAAFGL